MQPNYPKFFDDYEEKHAFLGALAKFGLPFLQRAGGKLMQQGPSAAWQYMRRMGQRYAPAAAQAAGQAAPRTWGQWGLGGAKNIGGFVGTSLAANAVMDGLGIGGGGQSQGASPEGTPSDALLQGMMNSPDPQHRFAAQQYLQQRFGFQMPQQQQPQSIGDMSLNGLMSRFGMNRQADPNASSPFHQGQQAQMQQPRTVYVPLMPQGTPQPGQPAPQTAARPAEGQPPSPAQPAAQSAPTTAARPAEGQPPSPLQPAAQPAPQLTARSVAGQPPAPAPRSQPMAAQPSPQVAATPPQMSGRPAASQPAGAYLGSGVLQPIVTMTDNAQPMYPGFARYGRAQPVPRVQPPAAMPIAQSPSTLPVEPTRNPSMTVRRPSSADATPVPAAGRPLGQANTPVGPSQQVPIQSPPRVSTPPPKPVPAAYANMPTATAAAPWFLRSKEAAAGGHTFFRKQDG